MALLLKGPPARPVELPPAFVMLLLKKMQTRGFVTSSYLFSSSVWRAETGALVSELCLSPWGAIGRCVSSPLAYREVNQPSQTHVKSPLPDRYLLLTAE